MGPANKIKKKIAKEKELAEITDVIFLKKYLNIITSQIKQMEQELTSARLSRNHIRSIIEKIKKVS